MSNPLTCYSMTLDIVRELSENATLRPAPNELRCLPYVPSRPVAAVARHNYDDALLALQRQAAKDNGYAMRRAHRYLRPHGL